MHKVRIDYGWLGLFAIYARVLVSLFTKRRWSPDPRATEPPTLPSVEATFTTSVAVSPRALAVFKKAAGWGSAASKSKASPTSSNGGKPRATEITPDLSPHVPVVFLISQTFRLAMAVMFSSVFPFRVLGSVVNRRAKYSLFKGVNAGDMLTHSCQLLPTTRWTPGGHLEFDLVFSSRAAGTGELVWRGTCTLVLLNPRAKRGTAKPTAGDAATPASGSTDRPSEATVPLSTNLHMASDAGRTYAALDGDISPMHLWGWMAKLVGFPRPVGNVHLVMGMLEAALAEAVGVASATGNQLPLPATLEGEFKSPTLLPAKMQVWAPDAGDSLKLARLAHSPEGLAVKLTRVPSAAQAGAPKQLVSALLHLGPAS